jgi:uncharacterized protein (TIGR01244 family)
MRAIRPLMIASATLVLATSSAGAQRVTGPRPSGAVPEPVLLDTTGMFFERFAKMGDDLFIGGQPTERALRELKARGVTTIVNLRTPPEMAKVGFDEAAVAKELGIKYIYLPVRGDSTFPYAPATVDQFAKALESADGKVLLHCTIAWRASHLWAAYLIKDRGLSQEDALANARKINLMDGMRMVQGRQPVEQFLDRDLTALKRAP